jgi:ubiquinone/menaquinone biosynthesis C-methylase UbiE
LAEQRATPQSYAASTGQAFTDAAWLDDHFTMARPEYEAQLRAVGIRPGWHVLDAASGSGSFLPWLAELVGPTGRVAALDLAPDNTAEVARRLTRSPLPAPVEATTGTLLALPYPDGHFDAAWCANTAQYFTDAELDVALGELRRVVRPGGLVALKDFDGALQRVAPAPPLLMPHFHEMSARAGVVQAQGGLRGPDLLRAFRRAGLVECRFGATLIERVPPLDTATRRLWGGILAFFAPFAEGMPLPEADRAFWAGLRVAGGVERFLDEPDVVLAEGNVLVVGTVPGLTT